MPKPYNRNLYINPDLQSWQEVPAKEKKLITRLGSHLDKNMVSLEACTKSMKPELQAQTAARAASLCDFYKEDFMGESGLQATLEIFFRASQTMSDLIKDRYKLMSFLGEEKAAEALETSIDNRIKLCYYPDGIPSSSHWTRMSNTRNNLKTAIESGNLDNGDCLDEPDNYIRRRLEATARDMTHLPKNRRSQVQKRRSELLEEHHKTLFCQADLPAAAGRPPATPQPLPAVPTTFYISTPDWPLPPRLPIIPLPKDMLPREELALRLEKTPPPPPPPPRSYMQVRPEFKEPLADTVRQLEGRGCDVRAAPRPLKVIHIKLA